MWRVGVDVAVAAVFLLRAGGGSVGEKEYRPRTRWLWLGSYIRILVYYSYFRYQLVAS